MAITQTIRFLLKKYSSGGDPHPSRVEFNTMIDAIENNAAMFVPPGTRPPAGKVGRWFWDATASRMYYDDGATWQDQNPNGGGGPGAKVIPGAAAAEGVSAKSARADHTHTIDLVTAAVDGAMPKADKAKLDAATDAATASALMRRDASGRVSIATPTLAGHATTKGYVDGAVSSAANAAADYADSAVTAAPVATSAAAGKMSAADKVKLDAATPEATPNTLMMTDASGRAKVATPAVTADAANKGYVDTAVTGAKTYADSAVSGAPAATTTAAGKMSAADKAKLDAASSASTPNTVMMTDAFGRYKAVAPSASTDVANKAYVDTAATGAKDYADDAVAAAPAATTTAAGKMSAADKVKLDGATYLPTADALVRRHSSGSIQVVTGTSASDAANKGYVDTAESDAKAYADDAVTAIPLVTSTVDGKMRKADKVKLDNATSNANASTIAMRDSAGKITVATPTSSGHAATKAYVDTAETDAKAHADDLFAAGATPTILAPLAVSGYATDGTIAVENLGTYKRVTVDIGITRTGGGGTIPNDSFASFGAVLPTGARGDSGLQKYLPIAISGGAINTHATLFIDTSTGVMQIKAQTAFTIQTGATFTVNLSYLVAA
ncbi:minor tail protein [Arthrobacter phage Hirko]|nr:minor tail protein [Arthrobacter phage Hirko]